MASLLGKGHNADGLVDKGGATFLRQNLEELINQDAEVDRGEI